MQQRNRTDDGRHKGNVPVRTSLRVVAFLAILLTAAGSAAAQEKRGKVTNLPLPRFVSLKAKEANARRGPSLSHRIDWVFKRRSMPLMVLAEHEHWRRVIDKEGAGGWVHYALLSGERTVIVLTDRLEIRLAPGTSSPAKAIFETDVVAKLDRCTPEWCRIRADGRRGWAPKRDLWGVHPEEILD